jgi:hypothetical protein
MWHLRRIKRLSSEDFLKIAEALWKGDAKVKYQNPDAWISYLFSI